MNEAKRNECMLDPFVGLPGPFSVVYADPPWTYYGDPNKDQACGKHYACMTDADLEALPVRDICAARAVVFLWATCPRLDAGIRLLQAWGLHYRGVPFVWVKTRKDGGIIGGQGIRPTLTKPTVEMVLAGCTTAKGRTLPILDEGMPQVVLAPRGRHSAKPAEVRDRIVRLMGDVPRVELFARERVQGWEAWGNEVEANACVAKARAAIDGTDSGSPTAVAYYPERAET